MKSLFSLILSLSCLFINAQNTFVSFLEDEVSTIAIYDVVYEAEIDSYIVLGNKIDSLNGLWLAFLDKDGTLIKENVIYGDTLYNFQLERRNKLTNVGPGVYFTSGILAFSENQQYELFFNADLEVIKYIETPPISDILTKFNFNSISFQDDLILSGTVQRSNFEIDTYIKRMNSKGEVIWETEIGVNDGLNNYYSSLTISDSLILLGTTVLGLGSSSTINDQCQVSFININTGILQDKLILDLQNNNSTGPTEVILFMKNDNIYFAFGSAQVHYDPVDNFAPSILVI